MDTLQTAERAGEAAVDAEGMRPPSAAVAPVGSEALALLKARFVALQLERKSAIETSSETVRSNEILIDRLQTQQKSLKQQLCATQRRSLLERQAAARAIANGDEILVTDDSLVSEELIKHRASYDRLRHRSAALEAQVRALDADAKAHALAIARTDKPLRDNIQSMERELECTGIQRAEAEAVGRAYSEIAARLRAERAGVDAAVRKLEGDLAVQTDDVAKIQNLSCDASQRMHTGLRRLQQAQRNATVERAQRTTIGAAHAQSAQDALATTRTALSRERARRDLLAEVAGDLGTSEEMALQASVAMATAQRGALADTQAQTRRKQEVYEEAWRRLRNKTGVGDIGVVLAELDAAASQASSLRALCDENETRIATLRNEAWRQSVQASDAAVIGSSTPRIAGGFDAAPHPHFKLPSPTIQGTDSKQQRATETSAGPFDEKQVAQTPRSFQRVCAELEAVLALTTSRARAARQATNDRDSRLVEVQLGVQVRRLERHLEFLRLGHDYFFFVPQHLLDLVTPVRVAIGDLHSDNLALPPLQQTFTSTTYGRSKRSALMPPTICHDSEKFSGVVRDIEIIQRTLCAVQISLDAYTARVAARSTVNGAATPRNATAADHDDVVQSTTIERSVRDLDDSVTSSTSAQLQVAKLVSGTKIAADLVPSHVSPTPSAGHVANFNPAFPTSLTPTGTGRLVKFARNASGATGTGPVRDTPEQQPLTLPLLPLYLTNADIANCRPFNTRVPRASDPFDVSEDLDLASQPQQAT